MPTNPFAGGATLDLDVLSATRTGLHQLAEHVLAADLHRHTGRIGLRPTPAGIGTPSFIVDGTSRQVRVRGLHLELVLGDDLAAWPLTTIGDAAAHLDLTPGAPDVYPAVTPLEPDRPLGLDNAAVRALADWFAVGADALERFAASHGGADPTRAQLWPEHFDLAISMAEVNYGVSPGDDRQALPYAYVGPWNLPPDAGGSASWWNQPYGRALSATEVRDSGDLVALFEEGWNRTS